MCIIHLHVELVLAKYNQKDVTFLNLSVSVKRSTCFRRFPSIIMSSKLQIHHQVFVKAILLPAVNLARLAAGSIIGLTII